MTVRRFTVALASAATSFAVTLTACGGGDAPGTPGALAGCLNPQSTSVWAAESIEHAAAVAANLLGAPIRLPESVPLEDPEYSIGSVRFLGTDDRGSTVGFAQDETFVTIEYSPAQLCAVRLLDQRFRDRIDGIDVTFGQSSSALDDATHPRWFAYFFLNGTAINVSARTHDRDADARQIVFELTASIIKSQQVFQPRATP